MTKILMTELPLLIMASAVQAAQFPVTDCSKVETGFVTVTSTGKRIEISEAAKLAYGCYLKTRSGRFEFTPPGDSNEGPRPIPLNAST